MPENDYRNWPVERLPVDPKTKRALPQREQPGYYPGFRTLDQQSAWDAATRRKILQRVEEVPPIRFFTPAEAHLLAVIVDHLLPQDDRAPSRRIPIVPWIDDRLFHGRIEGYRFAKMPPDQEAYRLGLRAIEQIAEQSYGKPFLNLTWREQDELLKSIHDGKPKAGAEDVWRKMELQRFWALWMQDCIGVYYAHPWAWDEIGFGGPAYPRAYMRLENGDPEPWEKNEKRYEWDAPPAAVSDPEEGEIATHSENPAQGQGGTH